MTFIDEIGRWITEHETLLSGMAALAVLAGMVFSPLGRGVRSLFARYEPTQPPADPSAPVTATTGPASEDPAAP